MDKINLKTGEIVLGGIRIAPTMTVEDFETYGEDKIHITHIQKGMDIVTLQEPVISADVPARVNVLLFSAAGIFRINVAPTSNGTVKDKLRSSRKWLFGLTECSNGYLGLYCTDSRIEGVFPWGKLLAQSKPGMDYGLASGELDIVFCNEPNSQ